EEGRRDPAPKQYLVGVLRVEEQALESPLVGESRIGTSEGFPVHRHFQIHEDKRNGADLLDEGRVLRIELEESGGQIRIAGRKVRHFVEGGGLAPQERQWKDKSTRQ